MNNINVFLCQSDKERHVRIGEIFISPILKLFRQTCWITSRLIEVNRHGGGLRSAAMQTGQGSWHANVSSFLKPGAALWGLTLPMLRLLSSKAQGCENFRKPSKPCHVGTHWKALAEYSQMSSHLPGFQSFFQVSASFCLAELTTSSLRVNPFISYSGLARWSDTDRN